MYYEPGTCIQGTVILIAFWSVQGHWFSYQRTFYTKVSLLLYFIHISAFYEFQIKSAYG